MMIPDEYKISMQDKKSGGDDDGGTGTVTLTRTKTQKPAMYKVLLLNDDYAYGFVIYVLQGFFQSAECNQNHVACAPEWRRYLWCIYV